MSPLRSRSSVMMPDNSATPLWTATLMFGAQFYIGQCRQNPIANCPVIRRRSVGVAGSFDHRVHEIGAADDAYHAAIAQYRQPFDMAAFHQLDHGFQRVVLADRRRIGRHHFLDHSAGGVNIFCGQTPGTEQEFQPFRPLPLRADLTAARKSPSVTMPINAPAASTTGRPLTLLCSISCAASSTDWRREQKSRCASSRRELASSW